MKKVGNFVNSTLKSLRAEKAVELHQLKHAWLQAVGPFLGSQTEPVRIKANTLFLVVSSSMWAQEINLQQRTILNKLKPHLKGFPPLKKLVCFVGEPHKREIKSEQPADTEESVPWAEIAVPPERLQRIEDHVRQIEDEKLRDKLRKLMKLSVQREIYLIEQGQLPCPLCGNFRRPTLEICENCEREREEERERKVMRLMAQKPWLSAQDLADRTHLKDRSTFQKVRKKLLGNWMLQAWQQTGGLEGRDLIPVMTDEFKALLMDITMLRCNLPAHSLQPRHFYFALGKRLAGGYLNPEGDED